MFKRFRVLVLFFALLLLPLGLQMLILCIASVVTRQWRRAAAFAFCLQWLYGLAL